MGVTIDNTTWDRNIDPPDPNVGEEPEREPEPEPEEETEVEDPEDLKAHQLHEEKMGRGCNEWTTYVRAYDRLPYDRLNS